MADPECIGRVAQELTIVAPKMLVVMGQDALGVINDLDLPLRRGLTDETGVIQRFTPSCEALLVPSIDDSLDEESAKRAFWAAFRMLGQWWSDLPPY
jgi:uracil-DNA glycosylase